ncbi:MAG: hypothetical protein P4L99_28185 [Chthoniobacter sp.]|nr:hypothetical protein [Chthoniobacter sp.]
MSPAPYVQNAGDTFALESSAPGYTPRSRALAAPLHVLTVITNPSRYASRYRLFADFARRVNEAGAVLHVAEAAFGERPHECHNLAAANHLQLRTDHEIWHKENLLNLLVARLPADWKYCAWVDADVFFARPDWVGETVHQLQHFSAVQMFSEATDLGPGETPFDQYRGFVKCYYERGKKDANNRYLSWHPGYAWAWRREALESVGGFFDTAILGSADQHMANGLIGRGRASINPKMHSNYLGEVDRWEARAERSIRRNVGYVPGLLLHHWHGRKANRGYLDRWKILVRHQYNPLTDLKRDSQGLWQLHDDGSDRLLSLRDEIRAYFRSRNEDVNEL